MFGPCSWNVPFRVGYKTLLGNSASLRRVCAFVALAACLAAVALEGSPPRVLQLSGFHAITGASETLFPVACALLLQQWPLFLERVEVGT